MLSELRSAVEHPFRVLKRQFGYLKVRYRGLFKNEQDLFTHFDLYPDPARRLLVQAG